VLSRQATRHNATINGLLPGRFETGRLRENLEFAARVAGHSAEEEAVRVRGSIPSGRFATPEEFGAAFEPRPGNLPSGEADKLNFHLAISASLAACAKASTSLSAFLSTTNVATAP
jgi:NAD(P)-dependent dehydrogenase (short-subunit alcohol dehydrogenase family)